MIQSMYIHGSAVMLEYPGGKGDPIGSPHSPHHQMDGVWDDEAVSLVEWSDVVGMRRPQGATFRGRRDNRNRFVAAIPTPTWHNGTFCALRRVALRCQIDPGLTISALQVFDGSRHVDWPFPGMGIPAGDHSLGWVQNINFFDRADGPQIQSGVCIAFDVRFDRDGNITFNAVGCDFEIG
jgi:hypothetical protein